MYKAGDKFEIEIENAYLTKKGWRYTIKWLENIFLDNVALAGLPRIENNLEELQVGDEVESVISGSNGVVVDCHVPNLDGEDKYTVVFANEIVDCSRQILVKTGKRYATFEEYLREVRNNG